MGVVARGLAGGVAATAAMTAAFALMDQGGTRRKRGLPPKVVAMRMAGRAGLRAGMTRGQRAAWTAAAHFGYGAAMGAVYGALRGERRRLANETAVGVAFGLAVWASSYAGWLPVGGLTAWPWRQGARMNGTLLAGHAVYGAILGLTTAGSGGKT
jgi:hypothetical protein